MKVLWRVLFALVFALLGMQGASACEQHQAASHARYTHELMNTMHVGVSNVPCEHSHSFCCMSMCGAHCGALLARAGFAAHLQPADMPPPHAEPTRASVSRAPPVPPPIV